MNFNAFARSLFVLSIAWLPVAGFGAGLSITSDPPGAKVRVNLLQERKDGTELLDADGSFTTNTPAALKKFSLGRSEKIQVEYRLEGFFALTNSYDYKWFASSKPSAGNTHVLHAVLVRSQQSVPVTLGPEGVEFTVDGRKFNPETDLTFLREHPESEWKVVEIAGAKEGFEIKAAQLKLPDLLAKPAENGRRKVELQAVPLRQTNILSIACNEPGTTVMVDGILVKPPSVNSGEESPLEVVLTFSRPNSASAWSESVIRVSKENFEWFPPDAKEPQPFFERTVNPEQAANLGGKLKLDHFRPVKFFPAPMHVFKFDNQRAALIVQSNELAEVSTDEPGGRSPMPFVQPKKVESSILLSRISVSPQQKRAYFAMANYDYDSGKLKLSGSTICYSDGQEGIDPVQLTTQPENEDTDPCVTYDGSEVYFSSLQNGVRCIKKISVAGGIPYPVTENTRYIDHEPTISKSGRLAFTRRVVGAPPNKPAAIYLQEKEQDLLVQRYGELTPGTMPTWSPNGEWIAFVGVDGGLYIVHPDGPDIKPRPVSAGGLHSYPAWDPIGTTLFFSGAKAKNQRDRYHYDIWRVAVPKDAPPGKPEPLTANGSLDASPACVGDGENLVVYFLSNRGLQRAENPTLEIYRLVYSTK